MSYEGMNMSGRIMIVRKAVCFCCAAVMAASLSALFFLPPARFSGMALCNQVFSASEKVNAYAYDYFHIPDGQSTALAWLLAAAFAVGYAGMAITLRRRVLLLLAAIGAALFQAYFGLSLPAWGNMALFLTLGLGMILFSNPQRSVLPFAVLALLTALLTATLWPGVDDATEALSEAARDRLALVTRQAENVTGENPDSVLETRHMNSRSLLTGEEKKPQDRSYRLITVEEQRISQPRWIDYLKIALLLLLSLMVVVLPFLPFLYGNARRKQAMEARRSFQAENSSEALCALFRHAAKYLENGGFGGGNLPYQLWPESWHDRLPEEYQRRFIACACLFEEAAYSDHSMSEDQLEQVRLFFAETERIFFDEADWKEKLRLRYVKCLHE